MPQNRFHNRPERRFVRPDDNYILFDVGASGELGNSKVTGFVSVNTTASKNDGNYQAITIGVRVPL